MDSPGDRDDRSNSQTQRPNRNVSPHQDENPFIAFRRYADQQISSILQSVVGLPSTILPPSTRDWQVFHDRDMNTSTSFHRWGHTPDGEHNDNTNRQGNGGRREDASGSGDRPQPSNWPRNQHDGHAFPSSIFDSMVDSIATSHPVALFDPIPQMELPPLFAFDIMQPAPSPGWPIPYLLFSSYSPLHLERQRHVQHRVRDPSLIGWFAPSASSSSSERRTVKEPRWKEAFEDLLRVQDGQEMLDWGSPSNKEGSEKEWLSGMISRGSLGEGWTHVRSPNGGDRDCFKFSWMGGAAPDSDRSWGRVTELSLYELFLRQANGEFDGEDGSRPSPIVNAMQEQTREVKREMEDLQKLYYSGRESQEDATRDQESQGDLTSQPEPSGSRGHAQNVMDFETRAVSSAPSSETHPSKLVSTSTRTERRQLPDGSTQTKTVVNKRFADGSEESFETDEVTDGKHNDAASGNGVRRPDSNGETGGSENKLTGSWFWRK